jgi:hypothetical protein
MIALKKLQALLIVVENFLIPPVENIFEKHFYDLVKTLGKVGQNMTTPPPPC